MSRSKPEFVPEPRILNQFQVATLLNRSEQWFISNRNRLEQLGFPKKDILLAGWDKNTIDTWIDKRFGINEQSDIENQMLEATRGESQPAIRTNSRRKRASLPSLQAKRTADQTSGRSNIARI